MRKIVVLSVICLMSFTKSKAQLLSATKTNFDLTSAAIIVDQYDFPLVKKAAEFLQADIEKVTGKKIPIFNSIPATYKKVIIIGCEKRSSIITGWIKYSKIDPPANNWETFSIQSVKDPNKNVTSALVISGSDRRGTAYGVFELSRQIGVSPWYWWADVPVKKSTTLYINNNITITDAPKVKYRGIFINDEAPALSNWSKEKFGGFNHQFYEKVFELMLRLKANYIWPAMWGNAFYYDDPLNIKTADEYGIVIGTSHHEPLMRAHEEWKYFGKGQKWNYDSSKAGLKEFWREGIKRATNEKIVTVGMRGDGDEPMSRETATTLLETIVKDQRQIIEEETGKPAAETPQLWALYKEVQDYYDKGMRVPDDVTLLLCDDNWGNIRKLPKLNEQIRKGGYGIYYHFDYVGGPRNYKWLNTNPIPRVWEQMHMAWEYNARQIWIVNVGDIKPMEFPISFFLDYAWNPEKIKAEDLQKYTEQWAAAQFGNKYAAAIANIISTYTKYNGRRKPELLDADTYMNFSEARTVTEDYNTLLSKAEHINAILSTEYKDAFFQLVLHPVQACSNLQNMYNAVAWNRLLAKENSIEANEYADKVKAYYLKDSLITIAYHRIKNGKWNHMMDQTHIGYTYWQQPPVQVMPLVAYVSPDHLSATLVDSPMIDRIASYPPHQKRNIFYELNGYISMNADHFTKAIPTNGISWKILPDHGRTGNAVTTFPVTAVEQTPTANSPHLEYEVYTFSRDQLKISSYFSPSLNFHNTAMGLQYAIAVDDEKPQVVSINKEDNNVPVWGKWVADNIIIKTTDHTITKPGKHIVKYWMVNSGVVLQKLVLDLGSNGKTYLGPPETRVR